MASGDIRGIVTNREDNPVEGVTVVAFEQDDISNISQTTTDASGEYVFDNTDLTGDGPWHVVARYKKPGGLRFIATGDYYNETNQFGISSQYDITSSRTTETVRTNDASSVGGIAYGDGGEMFYETDWNTPSVRQYTLPTEYDISTTNLDYTFSVSEASQATDIEWASGGTKFYVIDEVDASIHEYDVETAYDLSTASYVQSMSTQTSNPMGATVVDEGSRMHVATYTSGVMREYILSTPYDISTASQNYDHSNWVNDPVDIVWNEDGSRVFMLEEYDTGLRQYDSTEPYSLSTVSHSGNTMMSELYFYPRSFDWRRGIEYNAFSKPFVRATLQHPEPVIAWTTESDWSVTVEMTGMVYDGIGDHSGVGVVNSGYYQGSLTRGLAGYWPMDEGTGNVTGDETEIGNDGDIAGATWRGTGKVGDDSLSFDGTDDYVAYPASIHDHDQGSLSIWIYADSAGSGTLRHVYLEASSSTSNGFGAADTQLSNDLALGILDNGSIRFRWDASDSLAAGLEAQITHDVWQHWVATWDNGESIKLYRDGSEVGYESIPQVSYTEFLDRAEIGRTFNDARYFQGYLDDPRVYDRPLSPQEIESLANREETSPVTAGDTL